MTPPSSQAVDVMMSEACEPASGHLLEVVRLLEWSPDVVHLTPDGRRLRQDHCAAKQDDGDRLRPSSPSAFLARPFQLVWLHVSTIASPWNLHSSGTS
jgi:hypothetical protein